MIFLCLTGQAEHPLTFMCIYIVSKGFANCSEDEMKKRKSKAAVWNAMTEANMHLI